MFWDSAFNVPGSPYFVVYVSIPPISSLFVSRYAVLILDEAHERSVNCDILIGLLSRAVQLRRSRFDSNSNSDHPPLRPLRLVIMSATLRLDDFTRNVKLFPTPPPVLKIEVRMHPVTIHFCKRTETDYMKAATRKVLQIHKTLPAGSILVFVTGRREVHQLCERLRRRTARTLMDEIDDEADHDDLGDDKWEGGGAASFFLSDDEEGIDCDAIERIEGSKRDKNSDEDDESDTDDNEDENVEYLTDLDGPNEIGIRCAVNEGKGRVEIENKKDKGRESDEEKVAKKESGQERADCPVPDPDLAWDSGYHKDLPCQWKGAGGDCEGKSLKAVPLYALLSRRDQLEAFESPKDGERVVVVATNVAETSLTLPNIR